MTDLFETQGAAATTGEGCIAFTQGVRPFRIKMWLGSKPGWKQKAPVYDAAQVRRGFPIRISCPNCQHHKDMTFVLARDPGHRNAFVPMETSLPGFKCTACDSKVTAVAKAVPN